MSETDLTTCSLAYLREEFARARYFHNPAGVHYRLRLDKEIARRTEVVVDGDLCDITVYGRGGKRYCGLEAVRAAVDPADGRERLLCADHERVCIPNAAASPNGCSVVDDIEGEPIMTNPRDDAGRPDDGSLVEDGPREDDEAAGESLPKVRVRSWLYRAHGFEPPTPQCYAHLTRNELLDHRFES